MNNQKEIIEQAREVASYENKQTTEIKDLLKVYDERLKNWNKDVKHLVNTMKDRILKITK